MVKKAKQREGAQNIKRPHSIEKANTKKSPAVRENPEEYIKKPPAWAFSRCDMEHKKWSITNYDFINEIFKKLVDYERMTWQDIQSASGGKRDGNGTNSHFVNVAELSKEARDRLAELKLYDIDQLFSLRLTAKIRLYGILENGVFYILWYDKEHEIYETKKK
jgi:hypothetical protein